MLEELAMLKKTSCLLLACLLLVLQFPSVSAIQPDYSALFDSYEQTLLSKDEPDYLFFADVYEAFMLDPVGFIEEMAFREAWVQQALTEGMVEHLMDEQLLGALAAMKVVYYVNTNNPHQTAFPRAGTASENNLVAFLSLWLNYSRLRMAEPYRTDFEALFGEALEKTDGGAKTVLENHLFASLKCAPVDFLKALSQESETIQNAVMDHLSKNAFNCSTGKILLDALSAAEAGQVLSQKESALLNRIRELLADTPSFPTAPGPDPEELAARQTQKDAQNTAPIEPEATETLPPETLPKPMEPIPISSTPSGIDGWILLPVALAALALGFLLGITRKKR